ncbi:MAG TPA: B12-binding domain-containing protein, partial [Thermodesulfobacteriota bacterium]|nr:B12-binding domain-containing protein [Thermodesulfobacteriota bacterium]
MTHRERMLLALKGEWADRLPFAPRLDLWYSANARAGTLPDRYRETSADQIARSQGWTLFKVNPEYQNVRTPEDNIHWALGILSLRETVFRHQFPPEIDINVEHSGENIRIAYHTPKGSVTTGIVMTEEMKKSGVSNYWITEHALKGPKDYAAVAYIFENLKLVPDAGDFVKWQSEIGDDGLGFTYAGRASSPMHHIQKLLVESTEFYYHYHDYAKEMQALARSMENFFDQTLKILAESPAEVVFWGGNFDEMITYPPFFKKEIQPWIRRAAEILGPKGKLVSCHCDGENEGLMDLIRDSGMHIAESICPAPMTKVPIEEYYRQWSDKLTIFGGVPSTLLLRESTTDEEFEAYLAHLFNAIAPGKRMILGIADSTPPKAVFERLVRIGEKVQEHGRLPLEAGAFRPVEAAAVAKKASPEIVWDKELRQVQEDVLNGEQEAVREHVRNLLGKGVDAKEILERGMISAMEVISGRFKAGEVFIPEVLLSARVMNEAVQVLGPHLADSQTGGKGKVLIGTVKGDLHDIGKNLV